MLKLDRVEAAVRRDGIGVTAVHRGAGVHFAALAATVAIATSVSAAVIRAAGNEVIV
jgi:hypothetical protein